MNKKKFCPVCAVKKLVNKSRVSQCSERGYDNGVAMTPPMGWSSWNLFRNKISEELIKEIADAMKDSGLAEAGYVYVNIDDCWQASTRDENGRLRCDKVTFPSGIKALSEYVNARGLKLGIYSSNGTLTCEDYPASLRHEREDADTFAQWGVEYFKYDFCHNEKISSEAPKIASIGFSAEGSGKNFIVLRPSDLTLHGRARIVEDEDTEFGAYIAGIDARLGSVSAEIQVPESGEYIMTITVRKGGLKEKFLRLMVNGKDEYHIYCPGTKAWSTEGRIQTAVKLDEGENRIELSNPIGSVMDSAAVQYKLMGRELKRATKEYAEKNGVEEKPIVFSICEWGVNKPWKWGMEAGNLWRTTMDIKPHWISVLGLYEFTVRLHKYAAPGSWNDADMLEVGNGDLTFEENRSHFSLWCMLCAPLILGNDVRKFIKADGSIDTDSKIYQILTNRDMIAIDQDPLGVQCRRIKTGKVDVLVKPLQGSRAAVCVLNKSGKPDGTHIELGKLANLGYVNLKKKSGYTVYDVWEKRTAENASVINAVAEPHGVKVYIVE